MGHFGVDSPSGGADRPPSDGSQWPNLSLGGPLTCVVTATFLQFASLYFLLPTLPLYALSLGGTNAEVGLIIGILALTSLVARPFLGIWMDRAGRRGFLVAGAGIYVVASLGYWTIHSVAGLLLWRVVHGIGLATFSTAAASLAGDLAPPGRRGATMGVFGLAQASALTVGPGLGRRVLTVAGYPGLFMAAAGAALAALACALAIPSRALPDLRQARKGSTKGWNLPLRGTGSVPAVVQFAASIAYGTIISFIAVVARERGLDVMGTFFALLALSSLGVRLFAGRAYDAWGPARTLAPLLGLLAAGMSILAVARDPLLFLLAAVPAGIGIGGVHTTLISSVVDRSAPETRASSVAGFAACWELGVGGGTIVMGQLADRGGFGAMFLAVAVLPLLGLGGLRWLRGPAGRREEGGRSAPTQVPK
jgi:MFS family permease